MIYILLLVLVALFGFYGGICVGIADCKRRFKIPKSAIGVDEYEHYIYS